MKNIRVNDQLTYLVLKVGDEVRLGAELAVELVWHVHPFLTGSSIDQVVCCRFHSSYRSYSNNLTAT